MVNKEAWAFCSQEPCDFSRGRFSIYKGGDYNGQKNRDDKNNESRKDSEDK